MTTKTAQSYYRAWPDPITGPWQIELRFRPSRGRWALTELRIEPVPVNLADELADEQFANPPILTTTVMRALPLVRFVKEWRRLRRALDRDLVETELVELVDSHGKRAAKSRALEVLSRQSGALESSRAGHPVTRWTQAKLAKVAHVYATAWTAGSRAPTVAVATHFAISRSMAAKLVTMARDAGLLSRTSQGQGGWELERRPTS